MAVFGRRVQAASDLLVPGRREASRAWFRVDRGESQCTAPVGATSRLRAFVATSGTPVADSAESCTTWAPRGAGGEGQRTGHLFTTTEQFVVAAELRFVS